LTSENNVQKKCGFCGESIPVRAGRCPYCGSLLEVVFENNYRINPVENPTDNQAEAEKPDISDGIKPDDAGQIEAEQKPDADPNASVLQDSVSKQENSGLIGSPMTQRRTEQQPESRNRLEGNERPYYNNRYIPERGFENKNKNPLSNGMKVFLTALFILIPGFGQLAGIITAIVFMNSEGDSDRKSFGVALLVLSLIMFVFACIGCFVLTIYASSINQFNF